MKPCTPHDLRRTFITNNLEKGLDIGTVSKLAGLRDLQTTLIYDRRGKPLRIVNGFVQQYLETQLGANYVL
jgi:integrase